MKRSANRKKIEELLEKFTLKKTSLRLSLLEELVGAKGPLSQGELIARLEKRGDNVDRVSVYRNLNHLKEAGVVHELKNNSYISCTHECEDHPHLLLFCQSCNKFEEVTDHRRIGRFQKLINDFRFFGSSGPISLSGICSNCPSPVDA